MRQVELIQPRVIATLGNFATKLLTGSQIGITRVRGTPQAHTIAGQSLFIFPLLHPAAALRTPAMVDTLRSDFETLKGMLDQRGPEDFEAPETEEAVEAQEEAEPEADQLGLFG
jgi:DNA polymerase